MVWYDGSMWYDRSVWYDRNVWYDISVWYDYKRVVQTNKRDVRNKHAEWA